MIIRITSAVLTLAGALALLSGLLFWLGWALQLMSLHMLLGILAVAALWTIGFAQVSAPTGSWGLALGALVTGILTLLLGLYQGSLLVGPLHWIAQVVHLILGLATIGLGHMAAARFRKTGSLGRAEDRA
jgi:hypothetical protein